VRRIGPAVALLALATAACSQTPGSALPRVGTTAPTTSTTAAAAVAPFTGLALFNPAVATRPAVMIKIGDDPKARPQAGLDKADVVYEERVEGNTVRFLAVFQSQDASSVGPIRSVRPTDAGVVGAIGGVFVYSGGIPQFDARARGLGATVISEEAQPTAFHLRSDRQRPYKTYGNTAELRALASNASKPPALFTFLGKGEPFVAPAATPAAGVTVAFGPGTVTRWDWDAASTKWKRFINNAPHKADNGGQLAFTNLVFVSVPYHPTPFRDQAGAGVDEAVTAGTGDAVLLTGGQALKLRWSKPSDKAVAVFTDLTGRTVRLPAGQTWISLVPTGTAVDVSNPTAATASTSPRITP